MKKRAALRQNKTNEWATDRHYLLHLLHRRWWRQSLQRCRQQR